MNQPSFLKNITLRVVFTLPLRFRGLIVLPLLTRLYPQDIYGAWLQILLFSEFFKQLLSLRLETALIRYLSGEKSPEQAIKGVFTVTLFCSLCFIILVWTFSDWTSRLIFGVADLQSILLVTTIWISIQACMNVGLSTLRSQERIGTVTVRELLSAIWLVLSVYVCYLAKLELERLILFCLVGDAILLIWILFEIGVPFPLISLRKSIVISRKFLPYSVPLIFNSLFLWFTRSIDRFLIVHIIGLAFVSIYGVSFQVASLIFLVLKPINFVLFPRAVSSWNQGNMGDVNHYFSQAITLTIILSVPLIVGIFMTSDGLIKLLAGENYVGEKGLVFWLLLSCLANMVYQNNLYVIHLVEKTYLLPILFICTALLNFISGYILISEIGLMGAAISRAMTLIIMAVVVTTWARHYVRLQINWNLVFRVGLASFIMGLAIKWLPMDSWEKLLFNIFVGGVILLLLLILLRVVSKENLMMLKNQF